MVVFCMCFACVLIVLFGCEKYIVGMVCLVIRFLRVTLAAHDFERKQIDCPNLLNIHALQLLVCSKD